MAPVGGDNGNDGPSLEGLQQILDASDGHSTAALNHYIQLLTLSELKKLSKRRDGDGADSESSADLHRPRRGVAVPFERMRRRRLMLKSAKGQRKIRAKYRLQAIEDIDASEKDK